MKRSLSHVLFASLCLVLIVGDPALAHTDLASSNPVRGETLDRIPDGVRLEFDEPVEAESDPVDVFDEEGNKVDEEDARVDPGDPRVVTVGLAGLDGGETYRVEYRVISEDGDPTEDAYTFTLTNDARPADSDAGGAGSRNAASGDEQGATAARGPSRLPLYAGLGIAGVLAVALVLDRRGKDGGAR